MKFFPFIRHRCLLECPLCLLFFLKDYRTRYVFEYTPVGYSQANTYGAGRFDESVLKYALYMARKNGKQHSFKVPAETSRAILTVVLIVVGVVLTLAGAGAAGPAGNDAYTPAKVRTTPTTMSTTVSIARD